MKTKIKNTVVLFLLVMSAVFIGCPQVIAADVQRTVSTVTASTNHISYPPEYIIDGITTTRWQHLSFDLEPCVLFDFGKRTSFNKIVVLPTAATAVKEFKIEAADNPEMTRNRIILASGTSLKDENVFSFVRVSRRYIKYTVTKKDGTVGLLEFTVFQNEPYELELSEEPDEITIPSIGGSDEIITLPAVLVKDTQGHLVHNYNYDLEYSLESTPGVSVSEDGIVTVTEEAQEQEINVRVAVKSNSSVYTDIPLRLITKENLLWKKDVLEQEELNVLADGRVDTYFEPEDGETEVVFDLGAPTEVNKFILVTKKYEYAENVKISGALNEDFSDELQLADVGTIQNGDMVIPTERNTVRYIKLSMSAGGGIQICEVEAYSVYPNRLVLETDFSQAYIPGFDDGGAVTVPGVGARVVDIYGDKVHDEFSQVIWSATQQLPQGVTLDTLTGELTVEPTASPIEIELLASCVQIESINKILTVELLDKPAAEDHSENLAYYKTVKSSSTHGSFPAKNAVDGLEGSRLQFISSTPNPYLIVDLGEELEFNSLTIKFQNASVVGKATIRTANTEEELLNENSIAAQLIKPSNNDVTINIPTTQKRYVMICFEEKAGAVAIAEFEVRRIYPAIIYAPQLPGIINIPEEGEIVTPEAGIEIRDKFGSLLVFTESDYVISAENIPEGVSLDVLTGALTVTSSAPEGAFDVRITSTEDETVYNIFTVVLTRSSGEDDEQTEILLEQAARKFDILDYVSSAVADSDFTLPVTSDNEVLISYIENSDAIKIDSSGNVKVTRGRTDVDVSIEVVFELDGNMKSKTVVIKVPARENVSDDGDDTGSGGRGSGGSGLSTVAPVVKKEEEKELPEYTTAYSDIADVLWAEEYLSELVELKIMNGSDGLLRPKSFITREEFVKMIVCAFIPNAEKSQILFKDVANDSWCYGYIAIAAGAEVVYGISDELFGTGLTITRQDAAVIAKRAADAAGTELKKGEAVSFNDKSDIADYAEEAVLALSSAGIINGDDNGAFLPENSITRAEAAKIICLLIKEGYDEK